MAQAVFGFRAQLGESLAESIRHKKWIITKSSLAFFNLDNHAFDRSAEMRQNLAAPRQRDDTTEPRGALVRRNGRKFFQKQGAVR